jgi:hypothetical protein
MSVKIRILVLDRGHVIVGRCEDPESFGLWVKVKDGRVIRRWGAERGLAQLRSGPTSQTVLDDLMPSVTLPVRALLYTIDDLEESKWESYLPNSAEGATTKSAVAS